MTIDRIDHVALPMERVDEMLAFYRALGFGVDESMLPYAYAVTMGDFKINLHNPSLWQSDFDLKGPTARPGCGDLCFAWTSSVAELEALLAAVGAEIIEGPIDRVGGRTGGSDTGSSRYTRDPDGNLLEFIIY